MTTITTINTKLTNIIDDIKTGKTLKASKEELSTVEHTILGYKDQTIRDLCRLASTDRTKVAFISTLSKLIERFLSFEIELKGMNDKAIAKITEESEHEDDNILDSMENKTMKTNKTNKTMKTMKADKAVKVQTLEGLAEKVEVRNKGQRQACMYKDLEILADTIRFQLDSAQKSFLVVGACLSDANERIKKNGGTQADFLKWAFENCDIRKAQAYKLIKVHKDFGSDSGFKGVSMRVLYALTGQPIGIVEQARALAETGELDSKALDRLIMESQVQPDTNAPVETKPAVKGPAIAPDMARDKAPESKAPESKAPESNTESNTESETIASLKATIESLNETINSLQGELVKARTSNKPALPALPQFDSTCPATVIGLEVENSKDKVKVNRAYRALANIYTASNNPDSASKLKVARDSLLKAINS